VTNINPKSILNNEISYREIQFKKELRRKYRNSTRKEQNVHIQELTILTHEEGTYCCGACSEPLFESD
jgi:peptide methionine sulfoxide reductase MsrB